MLKRLLCLALCSAGVSTTALAHHSYAEYFRDQKVAVEGTLEHLMVVNPHAILEVRTDNGTLFTVEWSSGVQLQRTGFTADMLAIGDRLIVTASPNRNPDVHRVTLVKDIRRPRDGWQWSSSGVTVNGDAPRP